MSQQVQYRISFLCNSQKLHTLLTLLQPEVTDLKIEQERNFIVKHHSRTVSKRGSALIDAALEFLASVGSGKTFSTLPTGDLGNHFDAKGLKRTNVSPICTNLERMGKIRRIGAGVAQVM